MVKKMYNCMGDYMENKDIILITGGAGNIAKAVIKRYLDNECVVIATDIKDENLNSEFANNENYIYRKCDVTDVNSIKELKQFIEENYNRITHIISMAGDALGTDVDGIEHITIEDIDRNIKLNLLSHIYLTNIMLPLVKNENNKNKTITYVSSINALRAYDVPVYSSAKAGLFGLTRGILVELGKLNIRVNTIAPGSVLRPWDYEENTRTNGEYFKSKPQPKFGDFTLNTDIADALFSITHVMKKLVGQNIVIDAGQMA